MNAPEHEPLGRGSEQVRESWGAYAMAIREAVVINLDRDTARWEWMQPQISKLALPVVRQTAFTPETVPDHWRARFAEDALEYILPNNIASFASHLEAIARARDLPVASWQLILEDDVEALCTGEQLVSLAEMASAQGAAIVRLSAETKAATVGIGQFKGFELVNYASTPRGAGAYLINASGAIRVLERARGLRITTDNFLRREARLGLRTLGVMPPPVPQDRYGNSSLDPSAARVRQHTKYSYEQGGFGERLAGSMDSLRFVGPTRSLKLALGIAVRTVFRRRIHFRSIGASRAPHHH